ncbi:hypothetical protein CVT25_006564 [Psilocybe cyanescens]|uniref:Hydrophobin n=1 Tax=Psilocybe cyanescens TaxID=93625 RepID=A0A409X459_PSICY|nr:hypothetical protein CVT25_006564 [Psilocybe cyanescens]
MRFNAVFMTTALLGSISKALSATITLFSGVECTGEEGQTINVPLDECLVLVSPTKSIGYSGVPNQIHCFVAPSCNSGPAMGFGGGSGCATAPSG